MSVPLARWGLERAGGTGEKERRGDVPWPREDLDRFQAQPLPGRLPQVTGEPAQNVSSPGCEPSPQAASPERVFRWRPKLPISRQSSRLPSSRARVPCRCAPGGSARLCGSHRSPARAGPFIVSLGQGGLDAVGCQRLDEGRSECPRLVPRQDVPKWADASVTSALTASRGMTKDPSLEVDSASPL